MANTRAEVRTRVLATLNDAAATFFTTTAVNDSIQDIYHDIVVHVRPFIKQFVMDYEANTVYYHLYNIISDFKNVDKIWSVESKSWLDRVGFQQLEMMDSKWETRAGRPTCYVIADSKYVGFYPHPKTTVDSVEIYYNSIPADLADGTVMDFADLDPQVIEWGVLADLFEQAEEYAKAQTYYVQYRDALQRAKVLSNGRQRTDQFMFLWPHRIGSNGSSNGRPY